MPNPVKEYNVFSFHELMTTSRLIERGSFSAITKLNEILETYSCPKNADVEVFLKNQAVEQYRRRAGKTYLVFSIATGELLGYFTLALRPFNLPLSKVSKSQYNRLRCCGSLSILPIHATTNETVEEPTATNVSYEASAFLIGQLGRNFAPDLAETISGAELLDLALERIHDIQDLAGGRLVVVEAEDHRRLIDFYLHNGFRRFGSRDVASSRSNSTTTLIQMFRLIRVRGNASDVDR